MNLTTSEHKSSLYGYSELTRTLFPGLKVRITEIKMTYISYRRWMHLGSNTTLECMNACCVSQLVSDPSSFECQ